MLPELNHEEILRYSRHLLIPEVGGQRVEQVAATRQALEELARDREPVDLDLEDLQAGPERTREAEQQRDPRQQRVDDG